VALQAFYSPHRIVTAKKSIEAKMQVVLLLILKATQEKGTCLILVDNTAIWRTTTGNATEGGALPENIITFNSEPVVTTGSFVFNTEVNYRNATPENPRVAGQINEVQDMGLQGIDVQITGQLRQTSDTDGDLAHLVTWLQEDKTLQDDFPKGRFGLRMNDMPQFNITPALTFGYVLAQARIIRDGEYKQKAGVVITLRFSGDPVGLGT